MHKNAAARNRTGAMARPLLRLPRETMYSDALTPRRAPESEARPVHLIDMLYMKDSMSSKVCVDVHETGLGGCASATLWERRAHCDVRPLAQEHKLGRHLALHCSRRVFHFSLFCALRSHQGSGSHVHVCPRPMGPGSQPTMPLAVLLPRVIAKRLGCRHRLAHAAGYGHFFGLPHIPAHIVPLLRTVHC